MRKHVKLPAPQLSQLKEVNLELDMSGRHFALLASCEGQLPEDVVLSILKDLLDEDANKLTLAELRYLFMLVKINSLENNYTISVQCTHKKKDGTDCAHNNPYTVYLSDADLNGTPDDYEVPTIEFFTDKNVSDVYKILPPTMDMESALYNYFLVSKNANPEVIGESKELTFEFTYMRALMHLVDKDGNRFVNTTSDFESLMNYLEFNTFKSLTSFFDKIIEVNKFGVQNKTYSLICEECGGTLVFQLPLLAGLLN